MRLTRSIRLLAMAVLLAAPAAAAASPPDATHAVEPLAVKAPATDSLVAPQFVLVSAFDAKALALDSFVRAASRDTVARSGVSTSGALSRSVPRQEISARGRLTPPDSACLVSPTLANLAASGAGHPPNFAQPPQLTSEIRDTPGLNEPRTSSPRQRR